MINRIRLRDFKTHRDTTVDLGRLTVLVGPNGAGKSSVLMALDMISDLTWSAASRVFSGPRGLNSLLRRGANGLLLNVTGEGWHVVVRPEPFAIRIEDAVGRSAQEVRLGLGALWQPPPYIEQAIGRCSLLHLQAGRLAIPALPTESPSLDFDGAGLGAVLAEMILNGSERFARIVDDVRKVVPQVRGLRVRTVSVPVTDQKTEGRMELLVDFDAARGVPAHAVSDGTLVAIGLLTVLHADPRPKLLLLDDIDQALHPKAQWELIAALRRVLELDPELQIVATTHSPYLVDQLEADEVRVLALDAEGHTRCRALSEHPRARDLLSVLSTGELLGAEGEGWVVEGGDA